MYGTIQKLPDGTTVALTDRNPGQWLGTVVYAEKHSPAAVGETVVIPDNLLEAAKTIDLTGGVIDMLAYGVPVNGPVNSELTTV